MKYHAFLKNKLKNWRELELQIESLPTTKERGDVFEQFVYLYFLIKKNLYQISEVYPEKEIPKKYRKKFKLEGSDCGVDGLIIFSSGQSAGYQAKFRTGREKPSYAELTKFWAEARHTDYHYTIANCYALSELCAKHKPHLSILVDEFEKLDNSFFEQLFELATKEKITKVSRYSPDNYQKRMISNVIAGFKTNDRGKLIAACGTGKTLTALWITEQMRVNSILFLAPSLALIKQTLESWAEQSITPFNYLCVCSDSTVSGEIDNGDISLSDFNVPVTTDSTIIAKFISAKTEIPKIIFSTYQSLDVLSKGVKKFQFDITIFDEAHRTAGAKNSGLFALALHNDFIQSKKRLFMTATERLVKPWVVKKAEEVNRVVFSMDNEQLYGPVFDRFNFGEAIQNKIISDYKIIVAGVRQKEIYDWIRKNNLLVHSDSSTEEYHTYAQNIFRQTMLVKSMKEFPIKKVITFHSSVRSAEVFIRGAGKEDLNLKQIFEKTYPEINIESLYLDHINGAMSAGDRVEILDQFRDADLGVISNARCLTEGVDVPIIDCVYFVNPKNSLIDIVQACGRALRKPRDKHDKIAYFVIPILIPDGDIKADILNEIDFDMLHNLIQSLRDQDQRLSEWIDKINLHASQGKSYNFSKESDSPIVLDLPKEFDVKAFESQLYLKIAEVNGDPTRHDYKTKKYDTKERKSSYRRIFKTLGDYSVESYKNNLVVPTIKKFKTKSNILSMENIKINNNNVSHTERLGLIEKDLKKYKLTPLGKQFFDNKISFEDIFKRQMLRYFYLDNQNGSEIRLFAYRASLKILIEVKTINFIEFVFGLYSLQDSNAETINQAIEDIKYMKEKYPNVAILNDANKPKVLKELNDYFKTNFTATDIWEKKTTINNQYIYFRNHLAIFSDLISVNDKTRTIELNKGCEQKLRNLLLRDNELESIKDNRSLLAKYCDSIVLFMLFKF